MPVRDKEKRKEELRRYYLKNRDEILRRSKERYNQLPKEQKDLKRRKRVYRSYGLSEQDVFDLWEKQNRCCAICETPLDLLNRTTHIDHCHRSHHVRGLLCIHCNTGLGKLGDSVETVKKALEYLIQNEK